MLLKSLHFDKDIKIKLVSAIFAQYKYNVLVSKDGKGHFIVKD